LILDQDVHLYQRCFAAIRAISARRCGGIFAARAFPPREPSSAAANFAESGTSSVSSPVAILMTLTALPITSAGRFSPLGPFGMSRGVLGQQTVKFRDGALYPLNRLG
jgi:hypothetical protein